MLDGAMKNGISLQQLKMLVNLQHTCSSRPSTTETNTRQTVATNSSLVANRATHTVQTCSIDVQSSNFRIANLSSQFIV